MVVAVINVASIVIYIPGTRYYILIYVDIFIVTFAFQLNWEEVPSLGVCTR